MYKYYKKSVNLNKKLRLLCSRRYVANVGPYAYIWQSVQLIHANLEWKKCNASNIEGLEWHNILRCQWHFRKIENNFLGNAFFQTFFLSGFMFMLSLLINNTRIGLLYFIIQ